MAEKKFKGAPFGTQLMRFDVSGIYPALKKIGTFTEIPYCKMRTTELERNLGPGRYNVDRGDFSAPVLRERAKGPGWKRAQEMAWLAHTPHVLYKEAWEHKRFLKSKVGPGTYRTADFMELLQKRPQSVRGVCESREERFKSFYAQTPGPGSYGKGGIPTAVLDEKRMQLTGTCPTMDFGPAVERILEAKRDSESMGMLQNETPGPGSYGKGGIPTAVLDEKRMQLTGTCPTMDFGPAVERILEAKRRISSVDSGEKISMSLFVEDLNRPEKRKHGLFSKMCRNPECPTERIYHSTLAQSPRPASFPGPGWYTVHPPSGIVNQDPPPFLSSTPRISERAERLQNSNYNNVRCMLGPGTYKIDKKDQRTTLHSHHSAFKSHTQRYLHNLERDRFNQERLQPIHFPVNKGS
ncbi:ciliary microtubule-associated protein 2-like [Conger conger]|uniref:ciliary microtubule-associated protein 2-like n=1 Tax=Conger conger TaxID=82655 RepID=UPI002A5A3E56|nr:ciliary microtubule-associated protein 2-like [Conger conger]